MSSSSTTSLEESIKRAAISPVSNDGKKVRFSGVDSLKLMIKRPDGDIDEPFFEKLSLELITILQNIPPEEIQPVFTGSGHVQGVAWFAAENDFSMRWLKTSLASIKVTKVLPYFEILPLTTLPTLRRAIIALPLVPRLRKNAHATILNMMTRLNPNLNTKYWKVARILPPENGRQSVIVAMDEKSVETIGNQGNKIHYGLTKVFVKVYPLQTSTD